jgi:putative endonuclease
MYFTYILFSEKYNRYYTGHTENIEAHLHRHNNKMVTATKNFVPWHCIYFESFETKLQANQRELEIKKKKSRKYIEWLFQNGSGKHVPI